MWATRSLRFWIAAGMTVALLPVALSAVGGYLILNHGVVAAINDIALRQRRLIDPTQHLRLLIWDAVVPVDEFVERGDPAQRSAYRALRQEIEVGFARLHGNLRQNSELQTLVERAREDWTTADRAAADILSGQRAPDDGAAAELAKKFHGGTIMAVDRLGAIYEALENVLRRDHDEALDAYDLAQWIAAIAAIVSALSMWLGTTIIGRIMAGSVDRLVDGAARFANGDREHRVEVRVPPDLRRVADEFNRMIARIRKSEMALADLARRDGLTRLLNRRAFDETLAQMLARIQRTDEQGALLIADIDHFKKVNDTYGHSAGDEVLRTVAQIMGAEIRSFEHVFRIGGEEFAILLPGADLADAEVVAERLRAAVAARRIHVQDRVLSVTLSIGAAAATCDTNPAIVVEAADAALYRAKSSGRNQVVASGDLGVADKPQSDLEKAD